MKTLLKILFFPLALAYLCTLSLFIMPILYAKFKLGTIGFILCWLLYIPVGLLAGLGQLLNKLAPSGILSIFSETMEKFSETLNRTANFCVGYNNGKTVSRTIGERVEQGISNWVEITHLRILGTYDKAGHHGTELCKSLF